MGLVPDTPIVRRIAGGAVLIIMAAIAILSLLPSGDLPPVEGSDKVKHLIAYAALGTTMSIWAGPGHAIRAILLTAGFGAAMEVAQALTPTGREASWLDELANTIGAVAGWGLAAMVRRR